MENLEIIQKNIQEISLIRNRLESLCNILLYSVQLAEINEKDIEVLIITIHKTIQELKNYTDEINQLYKF